jgi:hypothetical protein
MRDIKRGFKNTGCPMNIATRTVLLEEQNGFRQQNGFRHNRRA